MRSIRNPLSAGSSPASPSAAGSAGCDPEYRVERLDPVHWMAGSILDRVGRFDFVHRVGWLGGMGVFGRFCRKCAVDSVRLVALVDPGLAGGRDHRFAGPPEGMTRRDSAVSERGARADMSAVVIATAFGGPDVLEIADQAPGEPGPGEALSRSSSERQPRQLQGLQRCLRHRPRSCRCGWARKPRVW